VPRANQAPSGSTRKGHSSVPRLAAIAAAALLALAGCSGAGSNGPTVTPSATTPAPTSTLVTTASLAPTPSSGPAATPLPSQPPFPLTLTDDEGTRVSLPARPLRIVSLTPGTTETLYALGGGGQLVGDTTSDDYPAAATKLPHVASYQGVSIEQLVALRPDLVLAGGDGFTAPSDIARIRSLGIPVLVVYAATVEGVLADIRLVGEASGLEPEALALTDAMDARIAAISAAASATGSQPRTFYEIGDQPDIYGPADDSFVADMVHRAGGVPITTGSTSSYTMPLERLVAADPQVIVLGDFDYGTTVAQVQARGGAWASMTAVRDGAIRPIDDTIVTRPGPRLADGLAALALAIHPGLALPGVSPSPVASSMP
jgi:cobalamin transport system substrate-binding protein